MKISRPFHLVTAPVSQTVRIISLAGLGQGEDCVERKGHTPVISTYFLGLLVRPVQVLYAGMHDGRSYHVEHQRNMPIISTYSPDRFAIISYAEYIQQPPYSVDETNRPNLHDIMAPI